MFNRSIEVCKFLIDKYGGYPTKLYKRLCIKLSKN